ncbi:MAG: ribonuclease R [candidate division KSB1 bacterium]|nr:ribonuclease R [candidate division KSB1 bacterium]
MNKFKKKVLNLLSHEPFHAFKTKEIQNQLSLPQQRYQQLKSTLRELVSENKIHRFPKNRFGMGEGIPEVIGELHVNTQGYGFVRPEKGESVFVSQKNMGQALNGDRVKVKLYATSTGKSPEGRIIEVIERATDTFVGTYHKSKKYGYMIPDDVKIQRDLVIAHGDENGAQDGQKVVCRIEHWEHYGLNPGGHVVEVLGWPDDPGVDILSIIHKHRLPLNFPKTVEKQAAAIHEDFSKEIKKRLDLRDKQMFTIDPDDAKDFDDAVSLEPMENGNWRLGVHIADVSHYVPERSALDREAGNRGNSVYLVDRVIPMLPERLSNELCSLEPNKDKLAFSVLMQLSPEAKLISYDIKPSVIHSNRRFTYTKVQDIMDGKTDDEYKTVLNDMLKLSKMMIKKRRSRGSIDFDTDEVKVVLDDKGSPVEIKKYERFASHRLVEEFMLLANETVARHVGVILRQKVENDIPFVYRVHEKPDKDEVLNMIRLARAFGIHIKAPKRITPKSLQAVSDQIQDHPARSVLSAALLRTMTKAKYSINNVGHFGLAYKFYTHFTSPIRRYPDLLVHRLLKLYHHTHPRDAKITEKELESACRTATQCEIRAQQAERDSIKAKQVEYMEQHLGDEFDGVISRIVNFGFFVNLPDYLIDGLVHVTDLQDDYYIYDETGYALLGQNTRKQYRLGQKVRVKLARVDRDENLIDFVTVED